MLHRILGLENASDYGFLDTKSPVWYVLQSKRQSKQQIKEPQILFMGF